MTRNTPNDLHDLPRMVPDRDDIAQRRGGPPPPPGGGGSNKDPKPKKPVLWPIYCLILLLMAGTGYLGYELWNSQNTLLQAESELNQTGNRLEELERQLSATDESLTMTDSAIQANFNNILSEIRKLWDVADGRNMEWIRDNQAAIATLNGQQSDQSNQLSALSEALEAEVAQRAALQAEVAEFSDVSAEVAALQDREEELAARLDVVSVRVDAATELTTDMSQQFNQLNSEVESLTQELDQEAETRASLAEAVSQLRSRVNTLETNGLVDPNLEERVDAIDNARRDTIQRLSNLQAQISELRERLENGASQEPFEIDIIETQ